jgi:hypothetical protein
LRSRLVVQTGFYQFAKGRHVSETANLTRPVAATLQAAAAKFEKARLKANKKAASDRGGRKFVPQNVFCRQRT